MVPINIKCRNIIYNQEGSRILGTAHMVLRSAHGIWQMVWRQLNFMGPVMHPLKVYFKIHVGFQEACLADFVVPTFSKPQIGILVLCALAFLCINQWPVADWHKVEHTFFCTWHILPGSESQTRKHVISIKICQPPPKPRSIRPTLTLLQKGLQTNSQLLWLL